MTAVARANGADRHRRRGRVAVAIAAIPILAGCGGTTSERDFCTQYADLAKAADQMKQEDPLNAEAGELRAAADDFQAELDQFQAVSEGRLDTALTTLRDDIDAVRQAALDARGEDSRRRARCWRTRWTTSPRPGSSCRTSRRSSAKPPERDVRTRADHGVATDRGQGGGDHAGRHRGPRAAGGHPVGRLPGLPVRAGRGDGRETLEMFRDVGFTERAAHGGADRLPADLRRDHRARRARRSWCSTPTTTCSPPRPSRAGRATRGRRPARTTAGSTAAAPPTTRAGWSRTSARCGSSTASPRAPSS